MPGGRSFTQLIGSIFIFYQYFFAIDFSRWKKLFSIDCVNVYLLSIFFSDRFCPVERAFLNWLFQYLSFLDIFFSRICPLKKLLSIDCVNVCLFSIFFQLEFAWWKKPFPIDCVNVYLFPMFFKYLFSIWKSSSQLILSTFIFSQYFFSLDVTRWKNIFSINYVNILSFLNYFFQ